MSLAWLKLSSWYRTKNAIRIKNPYPWHLARVQTPPPPPPSPQYESEKKFLLSGGGSVHRPLTPSLPHSLTPRKRCWWIADYSGVFMVTHLACLDEKRQHKESVLSMETTQCRVHKVTNVIEAKLSEERSRWKLEIILFSVDWAEVTIACSSTWHIEVKHMCENWSSHEPSAI